MNTHHLFKHGHCQRENGKTLHTVEYEAWRSMHKRCYTRVDCKGWYQDKGIQVCVRWHRSNPQGFENFLSDMGKKPDWAHSLDRINNTLSYMPSNCRWATAQVQSANRSNCIRIAADYSTRENYQSNYRKENRDAINARKREWRKARKAAAASLI